MLVVGGSYQTDFVRHCDPDTIMRFSRNIAYYRVAVTFLLSDWTQTSVTPAHDLLHLSFWRSRTDRKNFFGLPEHFVTQIVLALTEAGAIDEGQVRDGDYTGTHKFSSCSPDFVDHLPVIEFGLNEPSQGHYDRIGHITFHPSEYMDFVNDAEAQTCFLKIDSYPASEVSSPVANLNMLAIPDLNLWITQDHITICDAL